MSAAASTAPVVGAAYHCPVCCPMARAETAAYERMRAELDTEERKANARVLLWLLLAGVVWCVWKFAGEHAAESRGETP